MRTCLKLHCIDIRQGRTAQRFCLLVMLPLLLPGMLLRVSRPHAGVEEGRSRGRIEKEKEKGTKNRPPSPRESKQKKKEKEMRADKDLSGKQVAIYSLALSESTRRLRR